MLSAAEAQWACCLSSAVVIGGLLVAYRVNLADREGDRAGPAAEGELVEEGLAAHGDEGEDLLLSLARSLTERVEASEDSLEGLFAGVRQAKHEVEAALRPDDLAPEEFESEPEPTPWSTPGREPADPTEFVELPLFASVAATPSGNGGTPDPPSAEAEPTTPEPTGVTPADRDGDDAEDATPATEGEQLRLL